MNADPMVSEPSPRAPRARAGAGATAEKSLLEPARPSDRAEIAVLLRSAGLPHEDFAAHLAHFVVARDQHGAVIGAVGAEICGADALLRSLVVAPGRRGAGLGEALISALEAHAGAWGVQRWWLLTTTAERFFVARGFVASERAAAPAAIRATGQFNGGCSCAAVCLTRERRNAAP